MPVPDVRNLVASRKFLYKFFLDKRRSREVNFTWFRLHKGFLVFGV
jgi:hypothetical protein